MDPLARLKAEPLPFAELLGNEFVSATADRIVARMVVRSEFCTRPAVLHGGAIMAFADTLGAAGRKRGDRRGEPDPSRPANNDLADPHHRRQRPAHRADHPDPAGAMNR